VRAVPAVQAFADHMVDSLADGLHNPATWRLLDLCKGARFLINGDQEPDFDPKGGLALLLPGAGTSRPTLLLLILVLRDGTVWEVAARTKVGMRVDSCQRRHWRLRTGWAPAYNIPGRSFQPALLLPACCHPCMSVMHLVTPGSVEFQRSPLMQCAVLAVYRLCGPAPPPLLLWPGATFDPVCGP